MSMSWTSPHPNVWDVAYSTFKQQLGDYYKLTHNGLIPSNIKCTRTQGYVTSHSILSCKYKKYNFL